ncbi:hypothetical protein PR048_021575 [Dryococelus australis]|uniref:Uncharacterized protein n=1 Tax=Dryococelus australis TaxID=614101 RepID=A0ABQ9GYN7_9NEOP|nr:hypothetical protein PR048_021575 [Dryococelus australis]
MYYLCSAPAAAAAVAAAHPSLATNIESNLYEVDGLAVMAKIEYVVIVAQNLLSSLSKVRNTDENETHIHTLPGIQAENPSHPKLTYQQVIDLDHRDCQFVYLVLPVVVEGRDCGRWAPSNKVLLKSPVRRLVGATVDEQLARSPPTKADQVQSPAGLPDFRKWESCRTMPLVGGFLGDLPFSPPLHSGASPYSIQSLSSTLKASLLRATQISSLTQRLVVSTEMVVRLTGYDVEVGFYKAVVQLRRLGGSHRRDLVVVFEGEAAEDVVVLRTNPTARFI